MRGSCRGGATTDAHHHTHPERACAYAAWVCYEIVVWRYAEIDNWKARARISRPMVREEVDMKIDERFKMLTWFNDLLAIPRRS